MVKDDGRVSIIFFQGNLVSGIKEKEGRRTLEMTDIYNYKIGEDDPSWKGEAQ